jgi:hypothetical protein
MGMNDTTTHTPHLGELASWFEQTLHTTIGWARGSRLYGLTAGDGNPRATFLAEGWVYEILAGPSAMVAVTRFDALGLCCFGKATHLDTLERFRCRTTLVADAAGQCAVNRIRGRQPEVLGAPTGPVADLVRALYAST